MSLTIMQWEEKAKELDSSKRAALIAAINTLDEWDAFHEHYSWVGLDSIKAILDCVQHECEDSVGADQRRRNR